VNEFLHVFVQLLVTVLWLLVIGRVLLSWVNPRFEGPVARFLYETTEPLLAPIRRVLPQSGMIDWSPLVLMLLLGVLLRVVLYA
jgi:YggT family protein